MSKEQDSGKQGTGFAFNDVNLEEQMAVDWDIETEEYERQIVAPGEVGMDDGLGHLDTGPMEGTIAIAFYNREEDTGYLAHFRRQGHGSTKRRTGEEFLYDNMGLFIDTVHREADDLSDLEALVTGNSEFSYSELEADSGDWKFDSNYRQMLKDFAGTQALVSQMVSNPEYETRMAWEDFEYTPNVTVGGISDRGISLDSKYDEEL